MANIEATLIHPGLWQGSRPPFGFSLKRAGFNMVVLCAEEFQPPHVMPAGFDTLLRGMAPFPDVEVVYAPNDDSFSTPPSREQLKTAITAAQQVTEVIKAGGKVLVTCWQGKNRSGLVSALALHKLLGISGFQAIHRVRARRRRALSNPYFVEALMRIEATQGQDPKPPV